MSETAPEGGSETQPGGETPPADEFKPITSQADLDRLVGDRVKRERDKYADYKDVKAKAAKLDEIEQANLSELDKANTRVSTAESERDDAKSEALRLRTAVKHGISLEDADLFLTGKDEETLTAQAKRLVDREADRKKHGNHVPREGSNPASAGDQADAQFARSLFSQTE